MFSRIFFLLIIFTTSYANADCNFISANYIKELSDPSHIKEIKIDVYDKRKYILNYLKILKSVRILPKLKKKFKAKIQIIYKFGKCEYQGNVRQNGDNKDHIGILEPEFTMFRSLNVELDKGNILNAVRFKLLIPSTRRNLNEILGALLLKNAGFIVPETFQVKTKINDNINLMIFQEDIRKEALERNKRIEGPMFEGDESIYWDPFLIADQSLSRVTNKNWFLKGENSSAITLKTYALLQQSYLESRQSLEGYDRFMLRPTQAVNTSLKNYVITMMIMNGTHGLSLNNRKFYFNSFTQSFEPIYYDGDLLLNKKLILSDDKIIETINDLTPLNYKAKFSNLKNKDIIFQDFEKRVRITNKEAFNFFNKSIENIEANEKYIQNILLNVNQSNFRPRNLKVDFDNYLSSGKRNSLNEVIIIKIKKVNNGYSALTNDNKTLILSFKEVAEIISRNKYKDKRFVYIPYFFNKIENEKNFTEFYVENFGFIKHSKNLLIEIDVGIQIIYLTQNKADDWALISEAKLKDWTIIFRGALSEKKKKSVEEQRFNQFGLTGCLNIYKSNFENTNIDIKNGQCEDSLNIVKSKGSIKNIIVKSSFADGIDIDFSDVYIDNILVSNSGNDCLDVSSGQYIVSQLTVNTCGDKGLSVGEKSIMKINNLNIENSLVGFSSKDSSILSINNAVLKSSDTCYEAKQKKQEFGGGKIIIDYIKCDGLKFVDKNSIVLQR